MKVRNETVILERQYVPKDKIIIKEGDYGQQAYLIQSGEVQVYLSKGDQEIELGRLQAGQIVGEMAFIFDGPRTASVRAITDCNLILISRTQFEEKLKESDPTIRAIVHMLSKRIIEANNSLLNRKSEINDLKETAHIIYQNIAERVSDNQKKRLQETVFPHLEALLESIEAFQDRYS